MFGLGRAVGAAAGRTSDNPKALKLSLDDEQAPFCISSNPYSPTLLHLGQVGR